MVPLLAACLAKDPAERPTAARLGAWLEERGGRTGRWPDECPTVLAGELTEVEHAAHTLVDLAQHATAVSAGQEPAPTTARSDTVLAAPPETRRRLRPAWLLTAALAAVAVVVAVVAAVHFGTQRSSADSSPSAQGRPSGTAASSTAGETPSATAQEPQETQESQKSQAPQGEGAAPKVIQAPFELATGESVGAGDRSLIIQQDGNLVIYDQDRKARWAAMTSGEGNTARFQADGNLVVYNSGGRPVWASRTTGHPGAVLVFQADGDVVITSGDTVLWAAGTGS